MKICCSTCYRIPMTLLEIFTQTQCFYRSGVSLSELQSKQVSDVGITQYHKLGSGDIYMIA